MKGENTMQSEQVIGMLYHERNLAGPGKPPTINWIIRMLKGVRGKLIMQSDRRVAVIANADKSLTKAPFTREQFSKGPLPNFSMVVKCSNV